MKIYFFCENKNSIKLSYDIARINDLQRKYDATILLFEWTANTVLEELVSIQRSLKFDCKMINIYDNVNEATKKAVRVNKNKHPVITFAISEYIKAFAFSYNHILGIQFNDASVRGKAFACACNDLGIDRLLAQDGFLNFTSKTNQLQSKDQNWFYGATKPKAIAVWGQALKDAIIARHYNDPHSLYVVGLPEAFGKLPPTIDHKPVTTLPIKALFVLQPFIEQKAVDPQELEKEIRYLLSELKSVALTLRPHPTTSKQSYELLKRAISRHTAEMTEKQEKNPKMISIQPFLEAIPKAALSQQELDEYDVIVTVYSTVFVNALMANKPCVIYNASFSNIEMPKIVHPLLIYCSRNENIYDKMHHATSLNISQRQSSDILYYLNDGTSFEIEIGRLISNEIEAQSQRASLFPDLPFSDVNFDANISRLQNKQILIISSSFSRSIGVGIPILNFVKTASECIDFNLTLSANAGCPLVNREKQLTDSSIVLINGTNVFMQLSGQMEGIFNICHKLNKMIVFYCHETDFVLDSYDHTKFSYFVKNFLPDLYTLTVSNRQADLMAALGARHIRTVYNPVVALKNQIYASDAERDNSKIVLMIGTQQKRKGVSLFSKVADIAAAHDKRWKFIWIGAWTPSAKFEYKSQHVQWAGALPAHEVRNYIRRAGVFFLSSCDDPMSLALSEALYEGIPGVIFSGVGHSELFQLKPTCGEVFYTYTPLAAFVALEKVFDNYAHYKVDLEFIHSVFSVGSFCRRMVTALGEFHTEFMGRRLDLPRKGVGIKTNAGSPVSNQEPSRSERWRRVVRKLEKRWNWLVSYLKMFRIAKSN